MRRNTAVVTMVKTVNKKMCFFGGRRATVSHIEKRWNVTWKCHTTETQKSPWCSKVVGPSQYQYDTVTVAL
jgi:hypothetical protein